MTPDKNQNINLLPADLQRKQQVVRQAISSAPVEYTAASNGNQPKAGQPLAGKPSRSGFFSRLSSGTKPAPAAQAQPFSTKLPAKPTTAPKTDFLKTDLVSAQGGPPSGWHWWQNLFSKKPAKPAAVSTLKAQNTAKAAADKPVPKPPIEPVKVAPTPIVSVPTPTPKVEEKPMVQPPVEPAKVEQTSKPGPLLAKEKTEGVSPAKDEAKKKSSEIFDVNLLSGEYAQAFAPQNQPFVFITSVAATAFVIILSYVGAYLYQIKKEANTRSTALINEELTKTIASYAPLEAEDTALQKKVAGITGLLASHISFKDFLASLEAATIPEVTYTAIAVAKSGEMSLTALATDYTALARQLAILQKDTPWVKSAIVTGATLARDNQAHSRGVEFEISIKVDPAVFKQTNHQ